MAMPPSRTSAVSDHPPAGSPVAATAAPTDDCCGDGLFSGSETTTPFNSVAGGTSPSAARSATAHVRTSAAAPTAAPKRSLDALLDALGELERSRREARRASEVSVAEAKEELQTNAASKEEGMMASVWWGGGGASPTEKRVC